MAIVITYDIPTKHVEFKQAMFKLGYKDNIPGSKCSIIYFPNTTLYHATKNAADARGDAENICNRLAVNLERCVATVWSNWSASCGEPFK